MSDPSSEELRARGARAFHEVIVGEHLSYEDVEAHIEGREDFSAHLAVCTMCADEVADLSRNVEESQPRAWWTWIAAAAVAFAVIGTLISVRQPQTRTTTAIKTAPPPAVVTTAPPVEHTHVLSAELKGVLQHLADGVLPSAKLVDDLNPATERTRGSGEEESSLALFSPRGVIEETRPRFRWQTKRGAMYVAEVYDATYRGVARSAPQRSGSWRPDEPLARGAEYSWQITERRGDVVVTAPAPPAPPARFRIIDSAAAKEVETAPTPLAKALIYAREGVVDRALEELAKERDPSEEIQRAVETLRRYQPAPTATNPPQ